MKNIKESLGDINMSIWNSIPLDFYTSPKHLRDLKMNVMKEVIQTQSFITETVIRPFWELCL